MLRQLLTLSFAAVLSLSAVPLSAEDFKVGQYVTVYEIEHLSVEFQWVDEIHPGRVLQVQGHNPDKDARDDLLVSGGIRGWIASKKVHPVNQAAIDRVTAKIGIGNVFEDAGYYVERATLHWHLGEYEKAFAEMNKAIEINPEPHWLVLRGNMRQARREFDKAAADYDQAIERNPNVTDSVYCKALLEMQQRDPKALEGFRKVMEIDTGEDERPLAYYAIINGHLTAKLLKDDKQAAAFLENIPQGEKDAWQQTLIKWLKGDLNEKGLLAKAADNNDRLTEARCYLGLRAVVENRLDDAKALFKLVGLQGNRNLLEYDISRAEYQRLSVK